MRLSKKLTAGLATGIAAISIATAAFAYFTADGSGPGMASVGSDSGVEITVDDNLEGLYPGEDGSVTMTYLVQNNSSDTGVVVEQLYSSISVDDDHSFCNKGDFSFDANVDGPITLGANDDKVGGTDEYPGLGTLTMAETGENQDACRGATVTVNLSTDAPAE